MKSIIRSAVFCFLTLLLGPGSGIAEETGDSVIRETGGAGAFKGTMYQIWAKLRTLSPKTDIDEAAKGRVVVTAGIRGSESTATALKPYWKEDRTSDERYLEQVSLYNTAQDSMEKGQLQEAITGLDAFIKQYPDSELLPNAVFARALALAGANQREASIDQFKKFIKENPQHPLRADAETAVQELGGSKS